MLLLAWLLAPVLAQAPESLALFDAARQRPVPVAVYVDPAPHAGQRPLAILSHGYGGTHTGYSFIAEHLAAEGYFVASVQHEVPGDPPLPTTGSVYEARKPSWQRGVENILFVIGELKKTHPDLDYGQVVLIGHSHGGDTSMLFAQEHPELVRTVISLDSRRMPFPRTQQPRLFSIRSSDQAADPGVLPTPQEQALLGMKIVTLPATIHNDMWDGGTPGQKAEILHVIDGFLHGPPVARAGGMTHNPELPPLPVNEPPSDPAPVPTPDLPPDRAPLPVIDPVPEPAPEPVREPFPEPPRS